MFCGKPYVFNPHKINCLHETIRSFFIDYWPGYHFHKPSFQHTKKAIHDGSQRMYWTYLIWWRYVPEEQYKQYVNKAGERLLQSRSCFASVGSLADPLFQKEHISKRHRVEYIRSGTIAGHRNSWTEFWIRYHPMLLFDRFIRNLIDLLLG